MFNDLIFISFQDMKELENADEEDSDAFADDDDADGSTNTDFNNPSQYVQYLKTYKVRVNLSVF